jgi:non-heme chloroperoxidase
MAQRSRAGSCAVWMLIVGALAVSYFSIVWLYGTDTPVVDTVTVTSAADGALLTVDVRGIKELHSVLYVHDALQGATLWDNVWDNSTFAKRYDMVRFDWRGHGRSQALGDGASDVATLYGESSTWAEDLRAVVRTTGTFTYAPTIVTWGYGGVAVLLDYVERYGTADIGSVVMINGAPDASYVAAELRDDAFLDALTSNDMAENQAAVDAYVAAAFAPELVAADDSQAIPLYGAVSRVSGDVRRAVLERARDYTAVLATLHVPVYLMYGGDDALVDPAGSDALKAALPNVVAVERVSGGSHMLAVTHAQRVDDYIYASMQPYFPDYFNTSWQSLGWTLIALLALVGCVMSCIR